MTRTITALCAIGLLAATQTPSQGLPGLAGATTLTTASAAVSARVTSVPRVCRAKPAPRLCAIHWHRHRANTYRARMGERPLPYGWAAERHSARRARILAYWAGVQHRTALHLNAWLAEPWMPGHAWYHDAMCVHSNEGSWTDTSATYMGGMQFDESTWTSNGGTGNPGQASITTQLRVSYTAWRHRGWHPWPNTARMCGLLP